MNEQIAFKARAETDVSEIVNTLLTGENIVLIGPNQDRKKEMLASSRLQLRKHGCAYFDFQGHSIDENAQFGAASFVVGELSLRDAIFVLTKFPKVTLLASLDISHVLGVYFEWGKFFQHEFGVGSSFIEAILRESLKTIRIVGVANPTVATERVSGFREKLLVERYNRVKQLVPANRTLDTNFEKESDACDPGWELDK